MDTVFTLDLKKWEIA